MSSSDTARMRVSGREVTVCFDLEKLTGDVLETLEEKVGGASVYAWLRRFVDLLSAGELRISELRTRDIIGLVYLGMAQADPDTTWQAVARSIAPYTLEFLPDEPATAPAPAGRPVTVGVSPDLGHQVPMPSTALAPFPGPLPGASLDAGGAHEVSDVPPAYQSSTPYRTTG